MSKTLPVLLFLAYHVPDWVETASATVLGTNAYEYALSPGYWKSNFNVLNTFLSVIDGVLGVVCAGVLLVCAGVLLAQINSTSELSDLHFQVPFFVSAPAALPFLWYFLTVLFSQTTII